MNFSSVQPILSCESRYVESRRKRSWIPSNFLFETSPPRIVGYEMLFLCISFVVPNTTRSLFLNDVVLDWESIQSPLMKTLAGFTFFQEMSTSAIENSLIPMKKACWALHFWNCFAQLEQLYIAHFTNHRIRMVAEWVADVTLLQIGLKRLSMRVTLDHLDELLNAEIFCFLHNCMWQSWHSEVNVYILVLRGPLFTNGRIHFHPTSISSTDTFIQNTFIQFWHFHPMTLQPRQFHPTTISSNEFLIQWHFHPMTFSTNKGFIQKKITCGTINVVRVSVKASLAEGRRRLHTNTAYARLSGFNRLSCAGDASPEGLLKVERRVFRCSGV